MFICYVHCLHILFFFQTLDLSGNSRRIILINFIIIIASQISFWFCYLLFFCLLYSSKLNRQKCKYLSSPTAVLRYRSFAFKFSILSVFDGAFDCHIVRTLFVFDTEPLLEQKLISIWKKSNKTSYFRMKKLISIAKGYKKFNV